MAKTSYVYHFESLASNMGIKRVFEANTFQS